MRRRFELASPRSLPLARTAVLALALVAAAMLIAPEQPWVDGQTCLRHQSPSACRVW